MLELKTYANRGDSMSVLGVAREVAALTGGKLKNPSGARPSRVRLRPRHPRGSRRRAPRRACSRVASKG